MGVPPGDLCTYPATQQPSYPATNVGSSFAAGIAGDCDTVPSSIYPLLLAAMIGVTLVTASAQTKITPPRNSYSLADDVKLGQEAAAEVKKELPLLGNERVDQSRRGDWGQARCGHPTRVSARGVQVHLRRRQPEGNQRVCPPSAVRCSSIAE